MRWPDCAKHAGAHLDVWGQCVHRGAPCVLRPGVCSVGNCRERIMSRLDLTSERLTVIEEGSDALHRHPAPLAVNLDPDELATAIVSAARITREERRAASIPSERTNDQHATGSDPGEPADLPAIEVWTEPDGDS